MNNPTAKSTSDYELRFVKLFTIDGVSQEPVTGEHLQNLFFCKIASEKSISAANLMVAAKDAILPETKMVLQSTKTNGELKELTVTGAETLTMAEAVIAVFNALDAEHRIKTLQEGTKKDKQDGASKSASKAGFLSALQAAKAAAIAAAAPAPAAAKK